MNAPSQSITVDPLQATAQLRQRYAQMLDSANWENAQLTVACRDLQARVQELEDANRRLDAECAQLRARIQELEQAQQCKS